jgi:hypothetical protein
MSAQYTFPENTATKLYIADDENPTMGEVLDRAREHFGVTSALNDLNFSCENVKVTGCSCCYDPSDYMLYLVISVR